MEKKSTLANYLEELKDPGRPVSISKLVNLSDMTPEGINLFRRNWLSISQKKRNEIVKRLVQLAEENFELNFDTVFSCCTTDPEAEVRVKAAEGLGESEDPAFIDTLIKLLENDGDPAVRASAASSLAKFSLMVELNRLRPRHANKIGEILLAVANKKGENIEVRRRALEAAGPLSLPDVKWAIREAYESNSSLLKISAIYAMGQNCDPIWLPTLVEELYNANPEIRYESASACGEIGEQEIVRYLIPLTRDPDHQVRLAALDALGKIGGNESKKALEECVRCGEPGISDTAAEALEYLEEVEDPLSFNFQR